MHLHRICRPDCMIRNIAALETLCAWTCTGCVDSHTPRTASLYHGYTRMVRPTCYTLPHTIRKSIHAQYSAVHVAMWPATRDIGENIVISDDSNCVNAEIEMSLTLASEPRAAASCASDSIVRISSSIAAVTQGFAHIPGMQ